MAATALMLGVWVKINPGANVEHGVRKGTSSAWRRPTRALNAVVLNIALITPEAFLLIPLTVVHATENC